MPNMFGGSNDDGVYDAGRYPMKTTPVGKVKLREMKTRKTKFGFMSNYISFVDVEALASIRRVLLQFSDSEYEASLFSKMGGHIEFTVHTNNEKVAEAMRGFL